ncbi:MAG: 1,6-anhydro-N-acetylmuramyl-L-alanine amidase AmpD [Candidatus Berkiellales bacterium]
MKLNVKSGLITSATFCASPNFDERPLDHEIDLLVIHGISLPPKVFAGDAVQKFFCNRLDAAEHPYFQQIAHLKVSSHFYIRRDGALWQFVPVTKRAWHAGGSSFMGRDNCNHYSIGIELEGEDNIAYTTLQYDKLAQLTYVMMQHFPKITLDRLVGHSDIAPHRKTDPGPAFDWTHYKQLVRDLLSAEN